MSQIGNISRAGAARELAKSLRDANNWIRGKTIPPICVPPSQPGTIPGTLPSPSPPYSPSTSEEEVIESTNTEATTKEEAQRDEGECCDPFKFQYVWPRNIKETPQPKPELTNNTNLRRMFQIWTCGSTEYLCTGASTIWSDGLEPSICYMKDAKWTTSSRSPFVEGSLPEFIEAPIVKDLKGEFQKYGNICRSPAFPCTDCWKVGLIVIVNTKTTVPFFQKLCREKIPARRWQVIVRTMPSDSMQDAFDNSRNSVDDNGKKFEQNYENPINKIERDLMKKFDEKTIYHEDGGRTILFPDF